MHDPLSWDDVRYFLAAVQTGGFGAAARRLRVRQSTVSRRVAALEQRLGGALFDRTAAGLVLTGLGRRVQPEAEHLEQAVTRITDIATTTERTVDGLVRVALTETFAALVAIPRVLPTLLAEHPRLRIELVVSDDAADLARRRADVAVRFFLSRSGDLVTRRVGRLATAVVATPALARTLERRPPDVWPFVTISREQPGAEELWRSRLAPGGRLSTTSFQSQLEAVRAGLGVAVLPVAVAQALSLEVLSLPDRPAPPPLDVWLATPRPLRRVPRVAAVFDALLAAMRTFGDGDVLERPGRLRP